MDYITIDLSSLTRSAHNYVIRMGDSMSPKIILNVCHSVIFEYDALCYTPSGACLQNRSASKYKYFYSKNMISAEFVERTKFTNKML